MGRFTSRDPELQYFSPYSYVGNDPLRAIDPTGREGGYFDKMTSLEGRYVIGEFGWSGLFAARSITNDAGSFGVEMAKEMQVSTAEGNAPDAMRHVYLSAALQRKFGSEAAYLITTLHEEPANQDPGRVMDLHNNRLGILAAELNPTVSPSQIAKGLFAKGILMVNQNVSSEVSRLKEMNFWDGNIDLKLSTVEAAPAPVDLNPRALFAGDQ